MPRRKGDLHHQTLLPTLPKPPWDGTELLLTPSAGFLPLTAKPRSGTGWP